jgi:hypothetical protein
VGEKERRAVSGAAAARTHISRGRRATGRTGSLRQER